MPRKTYRNADKCESRQLRFNEAAARCRGKPFRYREVCYVHSQASMRPRPDAAENLLQFQF